MSLTTFYSSFSLKNKQLWQNAQKIFGDFTSSWFSNGLETDANFHDELLDWYTNEFQSLN